MFSNLGKHFATNAARPLTLVLCSCRHFSKPLPRRPVRVYGADGEVWEAEKTSQAQQRGFGRRRAQDLGDERSYRDWEKEILGDMKYFKLVDNDKRLRRLNSASQNRKYRERRRLVVLEGRRLVSDALAAGAAFRGLYFSRLETLQGLDLSALDGLLFKVTHGQMEAVSGVTTPSGIVALCEMPRSDSLKVDETQLLPITLICDNIRDPGNMGTLLRSAAAVGCHKILVPKGSVDIWDPKVVRAGMGCHFRAHIRHNLDWSAVSGLLTPDCRVHLAETVLTTSGHLADNSLTDQDTEDSDSDTDMAGSAQSGSVGVAGQGVVGESVAGPGVAGSGVDGYGIAETDVDGLDTVEQAMTGQGVTGHNTSRTTHGLPLVEAFQADLVGADREAVLVVGGETSGLSRAAWQLGQAQGGRAVYLPMVPGVDSLNAAMAGTVLMYEVRRQLLAQSRSSEEDSSQAN